MQRAEEGVLPASFTCSTGTGRVVVREQPRHLHIPQHLPASMHGPSAMAMSDEACARPGPRRRTLTPSWSVKTSATTRSSCTSHSRPPCWLLGPLYIHPSSNTHTNTYQGRGSVRGWQACHEQAGTAIHLSMAVCLSVHSLCWRGGLRDGERDEAGRHPVAVDQALMVRQAQQSGATHSREGGGRRISVRGR